MLRSPKTNPNPLIQRKVIILLHTQKIYIGIFLMQQCYVKIYYVFTYLDAEVDKENVAPLKKGKILLCFKW